MYKLLISGVFLFIGNLCLSQVGIGTASPTKELDVNGQLRIRNLPYLIDS